MLSVLLSDRLSVSVRVSVCLAMTLLSLSVCISPFSLVVVSQWYCWLCHIYCVVPQYLLFVYGGGPSVSYPLSMSVRLYQSLPVLSLSAMSPFVSVAICQCPCPPGRGLSTSRRLSALPCRHLGVRVSVLVHLHALSICISSICISSICMVFMLRWVLCMMAAHCRDLRWEILISLGLQTQCLLQKILNG